MARRPFGAAMEFTQGREMDARMTNRVVGLVFGAGLLALTGCVGYTPTPTPEEGTFTGETMTFPAAEDILVATLGEIAWRYPVEGDFAVSFPPGMPPERARKVIARLEEPRAHVLTGSTLELPTYRIESVQVVGDAAVVQAHRPIGLPRPQSGESLTQAFTFQLRGGVRAWRVVATRPWQVGTLAPPLLNIMPEPEDPIVRETPPPSASDAAVAR